MAQRRRSRGIFLNKLAKRESPLRLKARRRGMKRRKVWAGGSKAEREGTRSCRSRNISFGNARREKEMAKKGSQKQTLDARSR